MLRIPKARKEAILNKMLSPYPPTIVAFSKQEGISEATLYNWRKQLRQEGRPVPEHDRTSENWSAQTKFAVVVETVAFTETELAEYCRGKGLYPDQIKAWRDAAIELQDSSQQTVAANQQQGREYRKQIKRLEADLDSSAMKGATMLATLKKLGVVPSFSRPRVSNDNPFAESLFRTCKYRPNYPRKPFESIDEARTWTQQFVHWYNHKHKHSGLKFVTPAQRHGGQADAILRRREQVYEAAKLRCPERWSGPTRNWKLKDEVWLNPERAKPDLLKLAA